MSRRSSLSVQPANPTAPCLHMGTSKFGREYAPIRVFVVNVNGSAYAFRSKSTAARYKGVQTVAYAAGNIFHGVRPGKPAVL